MIGVVIVTHGNLVFELLKTAEIIAGGEIDIVPVSVDGNENPDTIREKVKTAIKSAERGKGVLILTDMFGGTPSNICLSFLGEFKAEVVSGVNLPMVIKLPFIREKYNLRDAANFIREYGQKNISVASDILTKVN
ncbi:MAG: PTS sugar transporter subunit IIA [Nitrospinota bacterium]|jgi:PTS system mannose-specific IIA component